MSSIVLSSAVRQNLLALQQTAAELATTQNDLSTGKKVNTALDNPTNYFTASGLDNRASDISNLLDGISNGVQVLQAANTGLTSLQSLVSQAQSIANQALQTSIGYSTKANVTTTITGATSSNLLGTNLTYEAGNFTGTALTDTDSSDTVSTTTKLSGTSSTDGIAGPTAGTSLTINGETISFVAGNGATVSSATGATISVGAGTIGDVINAINAITGTTTASLTGGGAIKLANTASNSVTIGGSSGAISGLGLNAGTGSYTTNPVTSISSSGTVLGGPGTTPLTGTTLTIPVTDNGTTTTATVTFGTSGSDISTLAQLNSTLAADNLEATITTTGVLTISTTNDAASGSIGTLGGSSITASGSPFNPSTSGTNYALTASPVADETSQNTRNSLISQYNAILTQINNTASDSSYNGVNLLNGDQLELTFDETGKSKLSITGVQDDSAGLGLSTLNNGAFDDNNATTAILNNLNTVETTLRSQASAFGSNLSVVQTRQDFNTSLINVLQTGSANLTQADINQEAADSQALSTRQSLSISALSLANSAQQSVLQLLR